MQDLMQSKVSENQMNDCFTTGLKEDITGKVRLFSQRTWLDTENCKAPRHSMLGSWQDQPQNQLEMPQFARHSMLKL